MGFFLTIKNPFLSKNHYTAIFKVINDMKDKQWKPYYNSIHYICETTLRYDHKFNAEWPKGSYDFIGSDSKGLIYASYDKKDSTPQEIKEFLEKNFGFDLKLVRDKKNSIFGETIHT